MHSTFRALTFVLLALAAGLAPAGERPHGWRPPIDPTPHEQGLFHPGALAVLPDDGRTIYLEAFAAAREEIRIEICVLEDPQILEGIRSALDRGVAVRVLVDGGKYDEVLDERENLKTYLTSSGALLHLSNPIFPRSFPKVILIDDRYVIVGSACLDSLTFAQYRDYAYVSDKAGLIRDLSRLFESDWVHTSIPGGTPPTYNPTPIAGWPDLIVSPVNAAFRLVALYQSARRSLDVTSELLGNPTLESELAAAAAAGVRVRVIAPLVVNGATQPQQDLQAASLAALKAAGVQVRLTCLPEGPATPYMHARTAVVDGRRAYLGSISLSPDSITFNREVGLILDEPSVVDKLQRQFDADFASNHQAC